MRDYGEIFLVDYYFNHKHILNAERLAAIARYCNNLQLLFVGWNHDPDWDESALESLVQQRTTLEAFILPTFDMIDSGDSPLCFYATLRKLRELRLSSHDMGDPLLMDVARSCAELRALYLYNCDFSNTEIFFAFLKLISNLEVLHICGGESNPSFIPDLLSTLPSQNHNIRTLILRGVSIPRLPLITSESFPFLHVLDIAARLDRSSTKIENLTNFIQALQALRFFHIDECDMLLANPNETLLMFTASATKVFVFFPPYSYNSLLDNLVQKGAIFKKNSCRLWPWDGIDCDVFVEGWEYIYGSGES